MIAFIDDHRDAYRVEQICRVLPIAPSTYHEHIARRQDATCLSARTREDLVLKPEIARVFAENFAVCGVRKVWRQMMHEGFAVARCTVERLMRKMSLAGVIRGKPVRITISDKARHAGGAGDPATGDFGADVVPLEDGVLLRVGEFRRLKLLDVHFVTLFL